MGKAKEALQASIDAKREYITEDELCDAVWRFRFKQCAGKMWTRNDEWWKNQPPLPRRFTSAGDWEKQVGGTWQPIVMYDGKPLPWSFASWVPVWSQDDSTHLQPVALPVRLGTRLRLGEGRFPT